MNGSENRVNRKHRVRALWRVLALALCLALLGAVALADEGDDTTVAEVGTMELSSETPKVTISWYVGDKVVDTTEVEAGTEPSHDPVSKDDSETTHYDFDGWEKIDDVSYRAIFRETPIYTITWVDGNGNETTTKARKDTVPSYEGTPAKDADSQYTYTFTGWSPEIVAATDNATYTAQFDEKTPRSYSIKFVDGDGNKLQEGDVAYGETPAYSGETPTKTADAQYTYTFNNTWSPEIATVTGEQTYTAQFNGALNKYTITWKDENGNILGTTEVEYGTVPTYAAQSKASTAEFDYTFAWSPTPAAVTGTATYTAQFTPVKRNYTITFQDESGKALSSAAYPYGTLASAITAPAAPAKADNLFVKWVSAADGASEIATVTADAAYKPLYESLVKTSGAYTYRLNEAKTEATIIAWSGTDAELIVPAQFENANVVAIGAGAFQKKETLTKLEIPAGVKTIGDNAFADCASLESLTLPDSLEPLLGQNIIANDAALTSLVLRATLASTLNPADTVTHNITANGVETAVSVQLPMAVTDIIVTKNNVQENAASLTVDCNFTVAEGHSVSVESGATLTNNATMTNFGTITNYGTFTNAGSVLSCDGAVTGDITGGTYAANGAHSYADGKCSVCGAELPKLSVVYTGKSLTKTYDKLYNVSLSKDSFRIEDTHGLDISIKAVKSAQYSQRDVGKCTVKAVITLDGGDAGLYGNQTVNIPATITPKTLTITPKANQKKTYGAADPTSYTGTVKGLLSEKVNGKTVNDPMTGKLSRETGENVGRYRILQGTIDAGDNYDVQVLEQYFVIEAKSINSSDVGLVTIGNQRYTGEKVEPAITLRFGKNVLKEGTDFKVTYSNNVQPGMATVKLTGIGNYTGERETSFRILNIASGVNGSSSGFSSYSYSGFDDGEYESMEDYDEDEDGEEDLGKLILNGNDYGTILFDANGMPSSFVQFEEPIETPDGDENAPQQYSLTIIADPLEDAETGETLLLDDGEREQYDELHLRLTMPLVDTLTSLGYTEIVYEVDSAELTIPLDTLAAEIPLEDAPESEVIGTVEAEEEAVEGGEAVAKAIEELEVELTPTSLFVEAYDICVEQSEVAVLTERELGLLETYDQVTPTYRVLVRAVIEGEDAPVTIENAEAAEEGETVELPEAERLPARGYPANLTLRMMPLEDAEGAPVNALAVYISAIESAEDADVVEVTPALFARVDGMIYAELNPRADGLYAVGVPAGEAIEYAELEADEAGELEDLDGDAGNTLSGPSLSSFGTSFTFDENGNPVVDN